MNTQQAAPLHNTRVRNSGYSCLSGWLILIAGMATLQTYPSLMLFGIILISSFLLLVYSTITGFKALPQRRIQILWLIPNCLLILRFIYAISMDIYFVITGFPGVGSP